MIGKLMIFLLLMNQKSKNTLDFLLSWHKLGFIQIVQEHLEDDSCVGHMRQWNDRVSEIQKKYIINLNLKLKCSFAQFGSTKLRVIFSIRRQLLTSLAPYHIIKFSLDVLLIRTFFMLFLIYGNKILALPILKKVIFFSLRRLYVCKTLDLFGFFFRFNYRHMANTLSLYRWESCYLSTIMIITDYLCFPCVFPISEIH